MNPTGKTFMFLTAAWIGTILLFSLAGATNITLFLVMGLVALAIFTGGHSPS